MQLYIRPNSLFAQRLYILSFTHMYHMYLQPSLCVLCFYVAQFPILCLITDVYNTPKLPTYHVLPTLPNIRPTQLALSPHVEHQSRLFYHFASVSFNKQYFLLNSTLDPKCHYVLKNSGIFVLSRLLLTSGRAWHADTT
jgi:hypothetical protein